MSEDDISTYFSNKSKPVILAAKHQHKNMLRKNKAKWHELLMEDSDSDGEVYDETFDELENNLRNLNFNSNTDNYFSSSNTAGGSGATRRGKSLGYSTGNVFQLHHGIPKRDRNQLKTNNLRKTISKKMSFNQQKSNVWNEDGNKYDIPVQHDFKN